MVTADRTRPTALAAAYVAAPARAVGAVGVIGAPPEPAPDEVDALTLGRRIRDRRLAAGMTLGELAAAIDRAPSQVSAIENGKREPRLSNAIAPSRPAMTSSASSVAAASASSIGPGSGR